MPPEAAALRKSQVVEGRIVGRMRGGVVVEVMGYQGFVPERLVSDALLAVPADSMSMFVVHKVDPAQPSLILRPA